MCYCEGSLVLSEREISVYDAVEYVQYRYKRICFMYERLTDLNILYESFLKCKSSVDWKSSVQRYEANVFSEIKTLSNHLQNETYKQKPFVEFDLNERGKERHIKSLHISDRVLQRALCDEILIPTLYKYLVYDNGASVKGKGIEFTKNRLVTHLQKYYRKHGSVGYILIVDFSKFFDSIPHKQLIESFEKHINDKRVMNLIKDIVSTFDDGSHKSVGIGSQLSQIAGIYYPTPIDNYCKCVKGCKYYGRYMDDLYVIHHDKQFLKQLQIEIADVASKLGLTVHEKKTQIYRIDKGFTYLKLRTHVTKTGRVIRRPCKKNITRQRRKLKKLRKRFDNGLVSYEAIENSYKSWCGNLMQYNSFNQLKNMDRLYADLYRKV